MEKTARSLVRTLTAPIPAHPQPRQWLRVEADGVLLADLHQPIREVSVRTAPSGLADVLVRCAEGMAHPRARAHTITVSGRDFHYWADSAVTGPVRSRTWTVEPSAWRLTVPR